mgnify:CR=1 FL=1
MSLGKLTLVIHPFFNEKEDAANSVQEKHFLRFGELSKDPFGSPDNPLEQVSASDASHEKEALIYRAKLEQKLALYKLGIDFAADGVVLIIRENQLETYLDVERSLYDHVRNTVPQQNLHFYPSLSNEKPDFGVENNLYDIFLQARFSSAEILHRAEIFAFGEALCACVPAWASGFAIEQKLSKPVKILGKFSGAQSLQDATKQVELFWSHPSRDPDSDGRSLKHVAVQWDQ